MPMKVFVVEDEIVIAMMVEGMLEDLGHQVAGLATRAVQAEAMAGSVDADLAVLDINLGQGNSFPAARVLRERGVKLVFASGYGSPGLDEAFRNEVIIRKPFEARDLANAIIRATA
jgi:DNA-binding response OmpR family regulator